MTGEYTELLNAVLAHQYRYYVLAQPTISDYEYDQLEAKLAGMERVQRGEQADHTTGKPESCPSSDRACDYPPHIRAMFE
jgi:NAD-dependent DNA ligase